MSSAHPNRRKKGSFCLQELLVLFVAPHTEPIQRHLKAILAQSTSLLKFPSQLPLSNQTPLTPSSMPSVLQLRTFKPPSTPNSLCKRNSFFPFSSTPCILPSYWKKKKPNPRWVKSYSLLLLQEVKELRRKRYNQSSSPKRLDFSNL